MVCRVTLPLNGAKSLFQYVLPISTLNANEVGGEAKAAASMGGKAGLPVGGKLSWGWWRTSLCLLREHERQG